MKICFASNNPKKLEEISAKLQGSAIDLILLSQVGITEDIPETSETFVGNAFQKADYVFDKKGVFCFADDSGLEVHALNGKPGVFSARYAGEQRDANDNMDKVLAELENATDRSASFKTVIALIHPLGRYTFEGVIKGTITREKHGEKGFGYDPIFMPDGYDITFAQMPPEMKNTISHRALAVDQLVAFLNENPA